MSVGNLRAEIPEQYFKPSNFHAAIIIGRDVLLACGLAYFCQLYQISAKGFIIEAFRPLVWGIYWWFQGLTMTGMWVVGHECGHGSFFSSKVLNDATGLICHTILFTPYFSFKKTHRQHHAHHASIEKDIHFVPKTRSEWQGNYASFFADVPLANFVLLLMQQCAGFYGYLIADISGPRHHCLGTSHFNPWATALFRRSHRTSALLSILAILGFLRIISHLCYRYGSLAVFHFYGIPVILVGHWVAMIVFLQHTDPTLPHFKKGTWTYLNGALSTMDRDFLGWQGQFFLHGIAHYHVIHHLFPKIPCYYGESATAAVRELLGSEYRYSKESSFLSLWRNFRNCQFVEDDDEIMYYKDSRGHYACHPSQAQAEAD